jgi:hypothetical protein
MLKKVLIMLSTIAFIPALSSAAAKQASIISKVAVHRDNLHVAIGLSDGNLHIFKFTGTNFEPIAHRKTVSLYCKKCDQPSGILSLMWEDGSPLKLYVNLIYAWTLGEKERYCLVGTEVTEPEIKCSQCRYHPRKTTFNMGSKSEWFQAQVTKDGIIQIIKST